MATEHDPIFGEKQPVQFNLPPKAHVETRAVQPEPPRTSSGTLFGAMLTSAVIALVCGGAGAWGYLNYLQPKLKTQQDSSRPSDLTDSASTSMPSVSSKVDELSSKLDHLQSQVDHLPKAVTATDLEPLNQRLTALESIPGKLETLDSRVGALPAKLDQESRKITTMMADIDGVRKQVASLQTDLGTKLNSEKSAVKSDKLVAETSHQPPREIEPPKSDSLQQGIEFFRQKQYQAASEAFDSLTRSKPEDARVWYFAALARGLATRDWKGQAVKLVTEGVEREKAGTPEKSQIDAAFEDLTAETGKDWLAYYRRGAR
jgi:TolA-binding protein